MLPQLRKYWTDVRDEDDEYSFWRHEWEKHGTCAKQLPAFLDEHQYFRKSLELYAHWNASRILPAAGIVPGVSYLPEEVLEKLHVLFKKGEDDDMFKQAYSIYPAINCAHDKRFKNRLFYEFIICLDKRLNPISCKDTAGGFLGSCGKQRMMFPNSIHTRCK